MSALVAIVKPVIIQAINSRQVKELVVQLLEMYSVKTDNDIDNLIVKMVKEALLGKSE